MILLDCGHQVPIGDIAYEQEWVRITVSGTTASRKTEIRVVCESCAKVPHGVR